MFHEVRFPESINYGSSGGPGYMTVIIETDAGYENRVAKRSAARHRYNVVESVKSEASLAILREFYHARLGCAYGFRFKDWHDFSTGARHTGVPGHSDVEIAAGDGSATTFQLIKKYVNGGVTRTRKVTKPVTGSVRISVNGVEQMSGWSVNTTTGVVTFNVAPSNGAIIRAGYEFDVPVRFGKELDELFSFNHDTFGTGSTDDIPLVEILDEGTSPGDFFYGGAEVRDLTVDITLEANEARVQVFNPTVAGRSVFLPQTTNLAGGGPIFYIINKHGSNSFTLKNSSGGTVATIAANSGKEVLLSKGPGTWWVL